MSSTSLTEADRTPRYTPGDVVRDRYEVVELLGAGANGAVYRADDRYSGTEVALKVLSPEQSVEAARRELGAAKAVFHENVARVIDIDRLSTEPRCWLLTQEFVEGSSLDAYGPDGEHRLDGPDALDAIDQLLRALEAIHPDFDRILELEQRRDSQGELDVSEFYELQDLKASGFVHRDIKPQNIRRRPDGVVKVIDFGIASEANSTVHTRSATPEYAARRRPVPLEARLRPLRRRSHRVRAADPRVPLHRRQPYAGPFDDRGCAPRRPAQQRGRRHRASDLR